MIILLLKVLVGIAVGGIALELIYWKVKKATWDALLEASELIMDSLVKQIKENQSNEEE